MDLKNHVLFYKLLLIVAFGKYLSSGMVNLSDVKVKTPKNKRKRKEYNTIDDFVRDALFDEFFKIHSATRNASRHNLTLEEKERIVRLFDGDIPGEQIVRYWLEYRKFKESPKLFAAPYPSTKWELRRTSTAYDFAPRGWKLTLAQKLIGIGQRAATNWTKLTLYDIKRQYDELYVDDDPITIHRLERHFKTKNIITYSIQVFGIVLNDDSNKTTNSSTMLPAEVEKVTHDPIRYRLKKAYIQVWKGVNVPQTDSVYYRTHTLNSDKPGGIHEEFFDKSVTQWMVRVTKETQHNKCIERGEKYLTPDKLNHDRQMMRLTSVYHRREMSDAEKQAVLDKEKVYSGGRDVRVWSTHRSGSYVSEYVKDRILGTQVSLMSRLNSQNVDWYVILRDKYECCLSCGTMHQHI